MIITNGKESKLSAKDLDIGAVFRFPDRDNIYVKADRGHGLLRKSRLLNDLQERGEILCIHLASGHLYSIAGEREVEEIRDYDFVVH